METKDGQKHSKEGLLRRLLEQQQATEEAEAARTWSVFDPCDTSKPSIAELIALRTRLELANKMADLLLSARYVDDPEARENLNSDIDEFLAAWRE